MSLPEIIEIVPLEKPVRAEITVPGSKSITNRALILAALAEGEVVLQSALWSEDTQIMVEALQKLGFQIKVEPDPDETCNRTIRVKGLGGKILPQSGPGTPEKPLELFVGNAGTVARFLAAFACLGNGVYRLHGSPRMHERPQAALFNALRELGYRVDSPNDKLPTTIFGRDAFHSVPTKRECTVSIEESSQFASALLLCARHGGWTVKVVGENAEESPYVAMTSKLIEAFPQNGGTFQVEPDASSGSYFFAANRLIPVSVEHAGAVQTTRIDLLKVFRWPRSGWQVDERFDSILSHSAAIQLGLESARNPLLSTERRQSLCRQGQTFPNALELSLKGLCEAAEGHGRLISRRTDLGDSVMMAIVLSPFALESMNFIDLRRLRLQETERVVALRAELTRCGAKVVEEGDTLTVYPSKLHGAEIETYNDHRMAMCFAILGLKVPGIKIKNPACVKKTFPNFFQKLATQPPKGLGAKILGATGRPLSLDQLFAE